MPSLRRKGSFSYCRGLHFVVQERDYIQVRGFHLLREKGLDFSKGNACFQQMLVVSFKENMHVVKRSYIKEVFLWVLKQKSQENYISINR